jgi:para-aminobenzoate synthetase / 4-amino-4-deoxychorismate lyase
MVFQWQSTGTIDACSDVYSSRTGASVLANRFSAPPSTYSLFETLLWADGYRSLDLHLARLAQSALSLAFPFNQRRALACLEAHEETLRSPVQHKVRFELDRRGTLKCTSEPFPTCAPIEPLTVTLSAIRTNSANSLLAHKTTHRALYDREHRRAKRYGHADVIFLNERDEVTEGAISNLFARVGTRLLTPPVRCGLLPGIARQVALAQTGSGEAVLTVSDLVQADELFICNAVRGWRRVVVAT